MQLYVPGTLQWLWQNESEQQWVTQSDQAILIKQITENIHLKNSQSTSHN